MAAPAQAISINVACAANFTGAMRELADRFAARTGDVVQCTFGSTGMLYGQIKNGAPYDLFFAADEKRPTLLFEAGLSAKPVVYAKGTVVLWTADNRLASHTGWKSVLLSPDAPRIGIATPKTAPYGKRAVEALAAAQLYTRTEPKLIYGKSVGMAFQYAYSGSANVAFVALSQAISDKGKAGTYWIVTEAPAVTQAACVLLRKNTATAERFLIWLNSGEAQAIINKYGYE